MLNFVALGIFGDLAHVSGFLLVGVRVLGLNFLSSDTTSVENEKYGLCGRQ